MLMVFAKTIAKIIKSTEMYYKKPGFLISYVVVLKNFFSETTFVALGQLDIVTVIKTIKVAT